MPVDLKTTAIQFLQLGAAGEVEEAYQHVAPNFCHHNPYFSSDLTALKNGMRDNARNNPDKIFEVQRAIAEANMVAVHSRVTMPSLGLVLALVHLFRFENGKIIELWDIGQAQPETMINEIGMF